MSILELFRLDGQVAVVTGGGTGIGRAIALGLADVGADVVVAGRRPEPLAAVVAEIGARGGRALAVPTDVTVEDDVARLVAAVVGFGPLSIWVNSAGGLQGEPMGPLAATTEASWHTTLDRNLTSVFLSARVAPTAMIDGGAMLNVSSTAAATRGAPGHGVYSAAKVALNHLTQTMALELAPRRIRVNAIAPGHTQTADYERTSGFTDAQFAKLATKQPLGRLGCDDDFAAEAIYLCSRAASWVTGQTIYVSGTP
jgi:7-alpha-hydroxysteroid dehydrogenase